MSWALIEKINGSHKLHGEYGTEMEAEAARDGLLEAEPDQQSRNALSDVLSIERWG